MFKLGNFKIDEVIMGDIVDVKAEDIGFSEDWFGPVITKKTITSYSAKKSGNVGEWEKSEYDFFEDFEDHSMWRE